MIIEINIKYCERDKKGILNFISKISKTKLKINIRFINPSLEADYDILFIKKTIEKYYYLNKGDIDKNTNKREIVLARQMAMYFAKETTDKSLSKIGDQIGNRGHDTVIWALKTINNLIFSDPKIAKDVDTIRDKLK
jgi:chromosomal replication initiator protein